MYRNFFIHSSVEQHLGFFHVLVIVNSVAMKTGIHVYFSIWFPQGICLGVGLLGHMVVFQWKQWLTLFFGAPKSLQMVTTAMKLNDAYSLGGKL